MKILLLVLIVLLVHGIAMAADGGFLFTTFKGEATPMTEQIYFGISQNGRDWQPLNGGEPVLVSNVGEKGVRDPFLLHSKDGKRFFLLATDLSIHHNGNWSRAVTAGSKSLVIWDSTDLVKWSPPRLVKVAADDAGCTWAPEAIYDTTTNDYLVFWASKNAGDHFAKQRIWAARTKDFISFTKPFVYIDKPGDVIDTDIVRDGDHYYRFSKDEKFKAITMEVAQNLAGPWSDVNDFSLAHLVGYEGPACFQLEPARAGNPPTPPTRPTWCLLLDHYSKGDGYKPFITHDLSTGQFEPAGDFHFPFLFRHGSVLPITVEERSRLQKAYEKRGRE